MIKPLKNNTLSLELPSRKLVDSYQLAESNHQDCYAEVTPAARFQTCLLVYDEVGQKARKTTCCGRSGRNLSYPQVISHPSALWSAEPGDPAARPKPSSTARDASSLSI